MSAEIKVSRLIRQARLRARLSQSELAAKVGCTRNHISFLENELCQPSFPLVVVLKIEAPAMHTATHNPVLLNSLPPELKALAAIEGLSVSVQELNYLSTFKPMCGFNTQAWLAMLLLMRLQIGYILKLKS